MAPRPRGYTPPVVPVSAVLIAQNEEKTIGDALASVAFCDEIVVVDSGSTDGTREVAAAAPSVRAHARVRARMGDLPFTIDSNGRGPRRCS